MEDVIIEMKIDRSQAVLLKKNIYFTTRKPSCYLTDNMTMKEAALIKKTFVQLGFEVVDWTK